MTTPAVRRAVDAAFREEWGRVLATLIRRTGDWDLAEECTQDAFTEAWRCSTQKAKAGSRTTGCG